MSIVFDKILGKLRSGDSSSVTVFTGDTSNYYTKTETDLMLTGYKTVISLTGTTGYTSRYDDTNTLVESGILLNDGVNIRVTSSFSVGVRTGDIGTNSMIVGDSNQASGSSSACIGNTNTVVKSASMAIGSNNSVSGLTSIALGSRNNISSNTSVALGTRNAINGASSVAMGNSNSVYGTNTICAGYSSFTYGTSNTCFGQQNTTSGDTATAIGALCKSMGTYGITLGYKTENYGKASFVGGYGETGIYHISTGNYSFSFTTASSKMSYNYGDYCTILGGFDNSIEYCTVSNAIISSQNCQISTGSTLGVIINTANSVINENTLYTSVIGGDYHTVNANASYTTIIGGSGCTIQNANISMIDVFNVTTDADNKIYLQNVDIVPTAGYIAIKDADGVKWRVTVTTAGVLNVAAY